MSTFTTTTIDLTINKETRTVEAHKFDDDGVTTYSISQDLVTVRIGNGAKWHRPVFVLIRECEFTGALRVISAPVLNKRATAIIWKDQISHEVTKSKHVGSKVG